MVIFHSYVNVYQRVSYIANWLVVSTPLKNVKVSWDDEIPNIWKNKYHVPNHQPVYIYAYIYTYIYIHIYIYFHCLTILWLAKKTLAVA